ncbi:MAG: hypothetical protein KDA66_10820 [Planctomycetaceae bacterium]|nr:hypothetical protein [Planctomycetaceae bacterium]
MPFNVSRRQFLATAAAGAVLAAAPRVITASKTSTPMILGEGEYKYEVIHNWPQLPDMYTWQTTHNVAVDKDGLLYVIHEGREQLKDHPSIFVFDDEGKFIRCFGNQFQGGGHGIEVRTEGNEQFLYVCGYQQVKMFSKMTLTGEVLWERHAPMDSGVYAVDEASNPQKVWGRDRFMPTNFAFLPDGEFLLADGYGSFFIHHYDKDGNWKSHFGGPGNGEGTFNTPHGIWYDERPGREASVVVCDRAHNTVQFLTLDGKHKETLTGYGLPANIDTWNDLLLVPELKARLSILDGKNNVVARLGDDVERINSEQGVREDEAKWRDGKFVHPHDACFAANGDIFVAEWVRSGRISRLRRVS